MKKIVVVDDHPIVLATLKGIIESEGWSIAQCFSDGTSLLKSLRDLDFNVDMIIIDISLPDIDGLELTQKIKNHYPGIKVLIFTSQNSLYYARRCLEAGADGFLSKNEDIREIILGLNTILRGYSFFPDGVFSLSKNDDSGDPFKPLSKREFLVMKLLVNGLNNNEIARDLSLSEKTISTYKKRIFDKLSVNNILELADFAKRNNLNEF